MSFLSAIICAALWIIITFATGGKAAFALIGGVVLFVVVFIVNYAFRKLVLEPRRRSAT